MQETVPAKNAADAADDLRYNKRQLNRIVLFFTQISNEDLGIVYCQREAQLTIDEFNQFCKSLPKTTHVVQWGGAHVWKIGGKVFAIGGWSDAEQIGVTFKCTPQTFQLLKDEPGLRPAPYLASRGMSWLQWLNPETVTVGELLEHLWQSYRLVGAGLTNAKKREMGTDADMF